MKWFTNVTCIEEVKSLYRKLCFEYHPDLHPGAANEQAMKEINAEYEQAFKKYQHIHKDQNGKTYTKEPDAQKVEIPDEFKKIINALIHIPNITIDLVGIFIWITGNTYPYRNELKALGFKWGSTKKAWYWHPEYYVHYSKYPKHKNLDELKAKWGCDTIESEAVPQIA